MMKRRIFRAILGVALTVLLASLVLIVGVLHGYFQDRALRELSQATAYIAHSVENEGIQYLEGTLPETDRITWVAADGTVLFDNWENPETMDGHINREEIREAMQLGRGSAVRYSETLSQSTLYYALAAHRWLRSAAGRDPVLRMDAGATGASAGGRRDVAGPVPCTVAGGAAFQAAGRAYQRTGPRQAGGSGAL